MDDPYDGLSMEELLPNEATFFQKFHDDMEKPPQKWNIYNLTDARKERPPTKWIVDGIIAESTLTITYGAPGSLKSFIIADMAVCVSVGSRWLVNKAGGVKTDATGVLWIDFDNGRKRTHERFDALTKDRDIPDSAPIHYISSPEKRFDASDINQIMDLQAIIAELDVGLVVLDNLALVSGNTEENSSGMAQVLANLRGICENTGVAMIVIHHQRKGGSGNNRAGDALRGHSSIEGAIDLALRVKREEDKAGNFSRNISIFSTKTRGTDVRKMFARFEFLADGISHDLKSAWFTGVNSGRGTNEVKAAIISVLEEEFHGFNQSNLVLKVNGFLSNSGGEKVAKKDIVKWLDSLVEAGALYTKTGDKNSKIYLLKDAGKA